MNKKTVFFFIAILIAASLPCAANEIMTAARETFATSAVCADYSPCAPAGSTETKRFLSEQLIFEMGYTEKKIDEIKKMHEKRLKQIFDMSRSAEKNLEMNARFTRFFKEQDSLIDADKVAKQASESASLAARHADRANEAMSKARRLYLNSDKKEPGETIICCSGKTPEKISGNKKCARKNCKCGEGGICYCDGKACPECKDFCAANNESGDCSFPHNISPLMYPITLGGIFILIFLGMFTINHCCDQPPARFKYDYDFNFRNDPGASRGKDFKRCDSLTRKLAQIIGLFKKLDGCDFANLFSMLNKFNALESLRQDKLVVFVRAISICGGKAVTPREKLEGLESAEKEVLKTILKALKTAGLMPALRDIDCLFAKYEKHNVLDSLENLTGPLPVIEALRALKDSRYGALFNIFEKLSALENEAPGLYDILLKEL